MLSVRGGKGLARQGGNAEVMPSVLETDCLNIVEQRRVCEDLDWRV